MYNCQNAPYSPLPSSSSSSSSPSPSNGNSPYSSLEGRVNYLSQAPVSYSSSGKLSYTNNYSASFKSDSSSSPFSNSNPNSNSISGPYSNFIPYPGSRTNSRQGTNPVYNTSKKPSSQSSQKSLPGNPYFSMGLDAIISYSASDCNSSLEPSIGSTNPIGSMVPDFSSVFSSYGGFQIPASYRMSMENTHVYVPPRDYFESIIKTSYSSHPGVFLKTTGPARFIDSTDDIQELVEETFLKVTGKTLHDISIKVCDEAEMKRLHNNWHKGILGFSLNFGIGNMVFVKKDTIEKLLITIGHEIGHVISPNLHCSITEEAKAFAFQFAWVKAIREHDIGELSSQLIHSLPAENGIHDKAFDFVLKKIKSGHDPLSLHKLISKGILKLE